MSSAAEASSPFREIEPHEVERYGVAGVEESTMFPSSKCVRMTGLVEKPTANDAPSRFGIFGRYLLEPAIWDVIRQTCSDGKGEIQLTDALNLFCRKRPLFGLHFEGQHYDAGDRVGYLKANIDLSLRDPHLRQPLLEYLSRLQG
jgi:UTP--glucose-1-phosphate uridylyltransferase